MFEMWIMRIYADGTVEQQKFEYHSIEEMLYNVCEEISEFHLLSEYAEDKAPDLFAYIVSVYCDGLMIYRKIWHYGDPKF